MAGRNSASAGPSIFVGYKSTSYVPVIILGSPRSGTSLTARMLSEWGAYGGEADEQQQPDARNPRGYFEWLPLIKFHVNLFDSVPVTPLHAAFESFLIERSADPRWRMEAAALMQRMSNRSPCWFWKYPQYVWALPFWTRVMPGTRYVVCLREPRSTCDSMASMYIPAEVASRIQSKPILLLLWQHHMVEILRWMAGGQAAFYVSYEEFLARPTSECARLVSFLGTSPSSRSCEAVTVDLVRCIEPNLQTAQVDYTEPLSPTQERLWRYLQTKREDPSSAGDSAEYALGPLERELLNAVLLLNDYHYRLQNCMSWVASAP